MINKTKLEEKYNAQKKLLDDLRNNATLEKWKILSKAYKIGKKIWGNSFTRERLAHDMDIPMTTALRCLALDKANSRTLKLMKQGKISAFKVAQICYTKSNTFQDEIVDLVIEGNISTYNIKTIKIDRLSDVAKEKHRLACEEGYSRRGSAYHNFNNWIGRGKVFMLMHQKHLPKDKVPELMEGLKSLYSQIDIYLKNSEVSRL